MKSDLSPGSLAELPLDRFCGIRPEAWLCVGAGYAREDLKTLLLSQGRGFVGNAVLSLQELCARILGISEDRILSPTARQEVLRKLFADPRIENRFPELRRLKRRKDFLRKLDQALQSGRLTYAHEQEEAVYHERLQQSSGVESPLRLEVRLFARAYEAWMQSSSYYDLPLLLRLATDGLVTSNLVFPEEIWSLSIQNPESLESQFWETLGTQIRIHRIGCKNLSPVQERQIEWQLWHTLDDAAEYLADQLLERSSPAEWEQDAVLMPDDPSVRRSLRRALAMRGIPSAEPRDPTRLLWDEGLKWALSPLEAVARNFQRPAVISWIRNFSKPENLGPWATEINARGVRAGLKRYCGEPLSELFTELKKVSDHLGGKRTAAEQAKAHIEYLKLMSRGDSDNRLWAIQFLESVWTGLQEDLQRVSEDTRKAPPLFWYEKLQLRLRESAPPVDGMKPGQGIRIYRVQQAPVFTAKRLWILGLPAHALTGDGTASQWYSEREREILASEFEVRSSEQVHQERLQTLLAWLSASELCTVLDAHYDFEGRERETLLPVLEELGFELGQSFPEKPQEMGAHSRLGRSYTALQVPPPQEVRLSPLPNQPGGVGPVITATTLDRYSRCSFQALAYHRWKLRDVREPEPDLWPDVKGNLLHAAVKILLKSYQQTGDFGVTPEAALEQVWDKKSPKGLIQSERIHRYLRSRMQDTLRVFCEKEKAYAIKSGAKPVSLDDRILKLEYTEFSILGQPDRIDEFEGGYFLMDYKSSGTLPHGSEMIERGYRLQLPFYGVALSKNTQRAVCGLQFVELDIRGGRKSGILFKEFNGKDPGNLTEARANSKSLISEEPHAVWKSLEEKIRATATSYILGDFVAQPNVAVRQRECARCRVQDLCGYRRLVQGDSATGSSSEVLVEVPNE